MNYSEFKDWRNNFCNDMKDLTFSHPDDYFLYTSVKYNNALSFKASQVLFAEDITQAIDYIKHIFLYDVINDNIDDLEFDIYCPKNEVQKNSIMLLNYWFKLGKISASYEEFKAFCKEFNGKFNSDQFECEIQILNGADELRYFLNKKYKNNENFDKNLLSNICRSDLFAGKKLNDFLNNLFI